MYNLWLDVLEEMNKNPNLTAKQKAMLISAKSSMSLFRDMVQTAGPDTEAVSKPLPAVQPSEALAGADPNPKQGKGKGKGKSKDKDEIKKRPPGPQHIVMRIIFDKANAMHFPENMEMSEKMKKGWQLYKQWKNAEPGTDEAAKIADYEALLRASWVEKMGDDEKRKVQRSP